MPAGGAAARVPLHEKVLRIPFALLAGKARRRLWSTRRALAVVRDFAEGQVLPLEGLHVRFEAAEAFDELATLLAESAGEEYLYLRPIERTRQARAGTLSVARTGAGEVAAFHFVHRREDHEALQQVAPNMYPRRAESEVLTEAVYCLPAFRGRAIAPTLLQATGVALANEGLRRGWAYLDTTNVAALRMFARAGYAPSGEERVDRYRFGRFSTEFRPATRRSLAEWEHARV